MIRQKRQGTRICTNTPYEHLQTVPNRMLLLKSLNFFNWTGVCEEPSFHANVVTFWD